MILRLRRRRTACRRTRRPSCHQRRIAFLAVCALLAAVASDRAALAAPGYPATGQTEPIRWLQEAALAPRRVSYSGTKTVTVWAQTVRASEVRIYHQAPDRTRLDYLAAGDQPERIVVINGGRQTEFVPGRGRYIEGQAPQTDEDALIRQFLPQLAANYDVRFAGAERVAGRPARIVDIQGRLPGRPRFTLWLDVETRLILRLESYGPAGALRETSAFLSVQLNPVLSAGLFIVSPPAGAHVQTRPSQAAPRAGLTIEEISRRVGFIPQLPAYLPPGYQFIRSNVATIQGTPTATFVFSDGVATIRLFESRGAQMGGAGGQPVRIGPFEGTVQARGLATVVHWNANGISMTLVGDVASVELVRVGRSVPPAGSSDTPLRLGGTAARVENGAPSWVGRATCWLRAALAPAVAEAALPAKAQPPSGWPDVPPVPVSPYITNNTHPIGPGIHAEETPIWQAFVDQGLMPVVVKVTVASDGVTKLPDGRLARLAWIWFVYGMDRTGASGAMAREAAGTARALAAVAAQADPRVDRITLSGYYHLAGRFDGRRTDATFTAALSSARLLALPPGGDPRAALEAAGHVWLAPELLEGAVVPHLPVAHDPHLPAGARAPVLPGDRTYEAAERFQGTLLQQIVDAKVRLQGLLFGAESRGMLWRGNPRRREIALTFDDGPSPLTTPLLLAVLRRYHAHATFFVIGQHARAYPYVVAEMVAEGDEVGNHTFHHPNMTTLPALVADSEIAAAAAVIDRAAGRPAEWFRPPGGDYTAGVAADARGHRLGIAMWTSNSGDWALPAYRIVIDRVLARAEPGAIILLHSTTLNTVRALPSILVELRRRGYALVTVSELARDAQ
ncbi:MAG TPA: polysaccharide deacetylase family protein [bacterium]|nr:polysaccharide deacetylase family protein [bacterium]